MHVNHYESIYGYRNDYDILHDMKMNIPSSQNFIEQYFDNSRFPWSAYFILILGFMQLVFVLNYGILEWIMGKYENMQKVIIQYKVKRKLIKLSQKESS